MIIDKIKMRINIFFEEKGVALLMILTSITLLSAVLVDFTFDTKINKLKVENIQDKIQARLNAEGGLNLAIARLKLYKEAFNLLQKNKEMKKVVGESLNQIWSIPFIYPIPETKDMNVIQRTAIKDFEDNSLVQGNLQVTIQNASNKLNVNLLRISRFKDNNKSNIADQDEKDNSSDDEESKFSIEKHLVQMLADALDRKKEENEEFNDLYADKDPRKLISAIKHFVSDKDIYEDEFSQEFNSIYSNRNITPKHAPLSSISEILLIDGWDQNLLDLIKEEITPHGVIMIDLNKITEKSLRLMIPTIDEDQIKEFFKYRDDPKDPHYFESIEDFKKFIVQISSIMDESSFQKMITQFKKAGVQFGATGSLFKVISQGSYNRANYSLTAFISLPAKPTPKVKKKDKKKKDNTIEEDDDLDDDDDDEKTKKKTDKKDQDKKKKTPPLFLLDPRTVEIIIS